MNEHDDDLRQLIREAADGVRPQGSLDDILDRSTKADRMTRRWFFPLVAAAAVIGLAIGGAAWLANDSSSPQDGPGPAGTPSPTGAHTLTEARVFYAGPSTASGGHSLFAETHLLADVADGPRAAAQETISGSPQDPDYSSLWPRGVTVQKVELTGGADPRITIALTGLANGALDALQERDQILAVEAVVRTVQGFYGTDAEVSFTAGPGVVDLLGLGFRPGDDNAVMAPVQILRPSQGERVEAGELAVEGRAATFEANVLWEVRSGSRVVASGHTTAAECCTLAPYSFTVRDLRPGTYTLVVHDEDMSGEGRPVNQDTKEFTVQ